MGLLRRFRIALCLYRIRTLVAIILCSLVFYLAANSGIVCNNEDAVGAVMQLCREYRSGLVMGSLCEPLCREEALESISCASQHSGKDLVFSAKWDDQLVYVKTAGKENNKSDDMPEINEDVFRTMVSDIVTNKLNVTISSQQLDRLMHLTPRPLPLGAAGRQLEREQVLQLLQSNEYLLSVVFTDQDLFPQVFGTCGHMYAEEHLTPPEIASFYVFNGRHIWYARMKLAIMMMDLLEQLETDFPDPLRLCDVKMSHFGLTSLGKLKFLDLDLVYPDNIVQRLTGSGQKCVNDDDCDLFQCKASCDPLLKRCNLGTSNNNLQVLCENIFVGWTLSGKLMVPGLLMTDNTPASLTSLLRQCAENGRSSVPEDIRQRLYTTLTEMDQMLSDSLSP